MGRRAEMTTEERKVSHSEACKKWWRKQYEDPEKHLMWKERNRLRQASFRERRKNARAN